MCLGCSAVAVVAGNLCEDCADELSSPLVPEQIIGASERKTEAALIDQWGRPHYLCDGSTLGRQTPSSGILVLDGSVSRAHARLSRARSTWIITDLESTNGTVVNGGSIRSMELESRDRVRFGSVSFVFVTPTDDIREPSADISTDTLKPEADGPIEPVHTRRLREETHPGLPTTTMFFREPTGGGGGLITIGSVTVSLPITQFEFLELLTLRMRDENHKPDGVRGYVRYSELLTEISWNTAHPTDNHVKQLVRRVRKALLANDLPNLIESRRHFGYRLCVIPILERG